MLFLKEYKHPRVGSCIKRSTAILMLFMACLLGISQNKDTTFLNEVTIKATRLKTSATGKKLQKIDSLEQELFRNQTLDVLLSNNAPVFVKNYGSGASQTTTFRGGNASQTAILWNGLNIQNSMLGQTDLSNISSSLFNSVDVEYGGSSALWGSGAMGGAVHLNNKQPYNKGIFAKVNTLNNNIGLRSFGANINYSNERFAISIKESLIDHKNEYTYKNDSNDIMKRKNAAYYQLSVLPEVKAYINKNNSFTASGWITRGKRDLPSLNNTAQNNVFQEDESDRWSMNWNYNSNKITNHIKAALFSENLNYFDSLAKIDSKSKMQTRIMENDLHYKWKEGHALSLGFNYTFNKANTTEYNGDKLMERYAVFASHKDDFLNERLITHLAVRYEHVTTGLNPLTYNLGAEYAIHKNVLLKLNGGKVYRIPTMNDLFWTPGGDPNLKPEEGYTADGTAQFSLTINKYDIIVSGSAFYKVISNWIQWVPSSVGSFKPVNLQEVFSRGTETSWQLGYTKNKLRIQLKCLTAYVLSTVNRTILEGDPTLKKQLIYTPRYTANSSLTFSYKHFAIAYFHNYAGYRFTSSDNGSWLTPYHYSTLRGSVGYQYNKFNVSFFGNINNILNRDYEVLQNIPQPLRYFEFGAQVIFTHNKKINIKTNI